MIDAAGLTWRPVENDNPTMESEPKRKRRLKFSLRSL
jgi:hypothetical protein